MDASRTALRCVCITGMHRTGTSVVAGLLQRHGLWLGDEADIMPADPYNPAGYFENNRLVELNDAILAAFGGTWSAPPELTAGWTEDPRLDHIYIDARTRGDRLDARAPWGFKDPRTAVTLPFWRAAWGDMAVIVTLRNPLETARSLQRRDGMPLDEGMRLWAAHYRSLLDNTTRESRIVIEYETLCADPVGSAQALLSRLPWLRTVDPELAVQSVRVPLRHHRVTPAELAGGNASPDVVALYASLRAESIHHPDAGAAENADPIATALSALDLAIRDVHVDVRRLAAVVARLEAEIGFIRSADLAGIAAQLDYQRTHELPGLGAQLDQIGQALPQISDRLSAVEAAGAGANGRPH